MPGQQKSRDIQRLYALKDEAEWRKDAHKETQDDGTEPSKPDELKIQAKKLSKQRQAVKADKPHAPAADLRPAKKGAKAAPDAANRSQAIKKQLLRQEEEGESSSGGASSSGGEEVGGDSDSESASAEDEQAARWARARGLIGDPAFHALIVNG